MRSGRTRLLLRGGFISAANRQFRGDDVRAVRLRFESRRDSRVQHVNVHAPAIARRMVRVGAQRSTTLRIATRVLHRNEKTVAPKQHDTLRTRGAIIASAASRGCGLAQCAIRHDASCRRWIPIPHPTRSAIRLRVRRLTTSPRLDACSTRPRLTERTVSWCPRLPRRWRSGNRWTSTGT